MCSPSDPFYTSALHRPSAPCCCADGPVFLPSQNVLLTIEFPTSQVLGMYRELNDIQSSFHLDRNIVNYHFLSSNADTISKIATKAYIKDLTTYATSAKRVQSNNKPSGAKRHQTKVPPALEKQDDIFSLGINTYQWIAQEKNFVFAT